MLQRLFTAPAMLLRLEGAALLGACVALFWAIEGAWLVFAVFFLAPDLSLLGYVASKRTGAALYNLAHTTVLPAGLGVLALVAGQRAAGLAALIWLAHIGADRLLGLGLKYPDGFKKTHFHKL